MVDILGIKTDLDLRDGKKLTKSPIGDSLNYINVSAPYYADASCKEKDSGATINSKSYKEALTTEIRTFANPDNYPIYLHCSLGRDRAGTLAYLISALVGVELIDLQRDYETSFFSVTGWADASQGAGQINQLLPALNTLAAFLNSHYPADSLMASTERFVKEYLGITQEEVDSIRNILLEQVTE